MHKPKEVIKYFESIHGLSTESAIQLTSLKFNIRRGDVKIILATADDKYFNMYIPHQRVKGQFKEWKGENRREVNFDQ